eukprot:COSAG06_NODE_11599_length_1486_cov_18.182408_2_plen_83_part_00
MSEWYADEKPSGKPFVPETGPPEYEDPLAMTEMRKKQAHTLSLFCRCLLPLFFSIPEQQAGRVAAIALPVAPRTRHCGAAPG